ncbi:hypothetical protein lerEdw1_013021 [Lerista edwardsae]|nr:hypothetical protein lerEdw1_013021 [Lerista edwardsae]
MPLHVVQPTVPNPSLYLPREENLAYAEALANAERTIKVAESLNEVLAGHLAELKYKSQPELKRQSRGERGAEKMMASDGGVGIGAGGPGIINIPSSILHNPNIRKKIIHALQAGRVGRKVFVAGLHYKVGWKKMKEVCSMAGVVVRADILKDKDGKSRGTGTVTFDQAVEAVQALSMFNRQLLFRRAMRVKMDKWALPEGNLVPPERSQQLPQGLEGSSVRLGPGWASTHVNHLNKGLGKSNLGPKGMGMERLGRFPSGMGVGRMSKMDHGGRLKREFPSKEMGIPHGFGNALEREMGDGGGDRASIPAIYRVGLDYGGAVAISKERTGSHTG